MISSNIQVSSWHSGQSENATKITRSVQELETRRLILRRFRPSDFGDLCCIFGRAEVTRHLGDGLPTSPLQTSIALESIINHYEANGFGRLAVIEKSTGVLIGYGGLRNLDGLPELVYLLDLQYWNRGLATEIGAECLRHGFEDHGFERIVAMTKPANLASRRVLFKLGMDCEGYANYYNCEVVFFSQTRAEFAENGFHLRT